MTAIWQAPTQEPDALSEAVVEAVRSHVFNLHPVGLALEPVPGTAWREARLVDGRIVRLALSTTPGEQARFGIRASATMRVSGQVSVDDHGYRLSADVVVDLATRAVLACECRLESVGRVEA
jgi:hypothetical protein